MVRRRGGRYRGHSLLLVAPGLLAYPLLVTGLLATAIVARLGGDEFAVVLPDTDVQLMTAVAGRIHADLRRTYAVHGHELELSASIGVVHTNGGPATPTEALRHADIAMYQAKAAGRDQWVVYSE